MQLLYRGTLVLFALLTLYSCQFTLAEQKTNIPRRYSWVCRQQVCVKELTASIGPSEQGLPMAVCKLNCAAGGALWPLPSQKVELGQGRFNFYPKYVEFGNFEAEEGVQARLQIASRIFKNYLTKMHPDSRNNEKFEFPEPSHSQNFAQNKVTVSIAVVYPDAPMSLGTDESYTLSQVKSDDGKSVRVTISANTFYGARHALETLSQLIAFNEDTQTLTIVDQAIISDKPFYTYRGILLDTSRNFMSVPILKRFIDGLSYNKLNFFHWHITDTHSFPFESRSRPQMTEYGAYSHRQIYSISEMKEIVEYGRQRGVKVLPEFDAPAHVGNGWEWGPSEGLGNLAVCINKAPWFDYCVEPPCGQLNPSNDNMYTVLGDLYKDFLEIFENDIFHMGGDEVNIGCWNSTEEITQWMIDNGRGRTKEDFVDVWGDFQDKAYDKLKEANGGQKIDAILWTSELVSEAHVLQYISNETYAIQIWNNGHEEGRVIPFLIQNGYRTIFSQVDPWYFDCGYGAWVGSAANNWCSPYKGWQQVYTNSPMTILANSTSIEYAREAYEKGLLLGGEAAMWTEQVDEEAVESKVWPRGSALAERLWTNPMTGWSTAEQRLHDQRQRMVDRGLHPDHIQPQWCHQNDQGCPSPPS